MIKKKNMQGELAQAKNGDELFWEDKSHAANWKAQACTQGALLFSFKVSGGKNVFFHFSLVHNVFPLCSLQVPNIPNVFPNILSIAHHFYPMCYVLLSLIWVGQRRGTLYFKIKPSILRSLHSSYYFILFFWSDRPIKLGC
jgi:hypothetical protein